MTERAAGRTPLIAGNWKMHKTVAATRTLLSALNERVASTSGVDVAVAPPFTALAAAAEALSGSTILLGAQNMHWDEEGAYTGEISPVMLTDLAIDFVILGHSERRALFGEQDADVARKLRAALAHDLLPIVCVGETREQREAGATQSVVTTQLRGALEGLQPEQAATLVVAYEPVWAIGTGLTATPEQAQEVHGQIRDLLREMFGGPAAETVRIQYGGSVTPSNAAELLAQPDIDGALVGGASLDADSFAGIVEGAA